MSKMSSKIVGIQFSVVPPSDIRNGVAQISSRDTYVSNKPVLNGLFDPRMGVLEQGYICPTDGLDCMKTPGYHGYLELAKPIFYIQHLSTVISILKCVCFRCSNLLINKQLHGSALNMLPVDRWNYVSDLCKDERRCQTCECLVPIKILKAKNEVATVYAEWKNSQGEDNVIVKCTPEIVLKIFKRISDDDILFMGFSPIWSRPEWMICQVLLIPPPAVRPSVRNDSQQRSEDDLTHILVNIIKTNKTLFDKLKGNATENVIDDWINVLTYYTCTLINNKLPGVPPLIQRSGRPLKSIKERINGKTGRMRGNLMAKRVDFSARTVIGAEPNISIQELGVPIRIAKNITKPVYVNKRNYDFCVKLVQNGPDIHPGAKTVDKKNGVSYNLRYIDRKSVVLEIGDVVHRHMIDGDPILFNRQPSLHRMSMMCHLVRIMMVGDTFRMNVADTKPYNADFDGDEMNLHMPQDIESSVELQQLAAVPYQIISPANNSPIIGIFQDNMLGSHLLTRMGITFSQKQAMNLLMAYKNIDYNFTDKTSITSFELLSQIMPPISINYKTKFFAKEEDIKTSNNVLDIQNGRYLRGHLEKSMLGGGSKGILHRICNDFGNMACANFIDNLQNIVTEYMKTASFSVGVSDLLVSTKTTNSIVDIITTHKMTAQGILEQARLGLLENNSGKTNQEELEAQLDSVIKTASSDTGRAGLQGLNKDNRFLTLVNAGSKGSELNITQMVACLGQQNVDGKRIPYGFDNRTLPHFTKADDSFEARGFVENSFINGLSPSEVFFHAMGGRIGLIDTAVKTSQSGYIQRRIIKALEDLKVHYDGTVRGSKHSIIQFLYGEDGIDTIKVETQLYPILDMGIEEIYNHFMVPKGTMKSFDKYFSTKAYKDNNTHLTKYSEICKDHIDLLINTREMVIQNIFKGKLNGTATLHSPVAFSYLINNISNQLNVLPVLCDISLMDASHMIDQTYTQLTLIRYTQPTLTFKLLYYYYLSPKYLLLVKRFNKASLTQLLANIVKTYKLAIVTPGEMVGMIAAQSMGEVSTQMTLNTFHFAGVSSKSNVTRGVPRLEEILALSDTPKNPSLTIYLNPEDQLNKDKATKMMHQIEHTILKHIVESVEICFDPDDENTMILEDKQTMLQYNHFKNIMKQSSGNENICLNKYSKWVIRITLDPTIMFDKNITMEDVNFTLNQTYKDTINCVYSDYNSDKLIFRVRVSNLFKQTNAKQNKPLDQTDQLYILKGFQEQMLTSTILKGVKGLTKVIMRKIKDTFISPEDGLYKKQDIWVLDTIGSNLLDVLGLDNIDKYRTFSNDIMEVYYTLGIEAARQILYNEIVEVIEFDGTYINSHHYSILCDRMTYTHNLICILRSDINKDNIGPIAKASFEETPLMLLKAARHGELDNMRGVSANIMCGQEGYYGTSAFQVLFDTEKYLELSINMETAPLITDTSDKLQTQKPSKKSTSSKLLKQLQAKSLKAPSKIVKQPKLITDPNDKCNVSNLIINQNISNIKQTEQLSINSNLDF